jgi:hypothetical protein
VPDIARAASLWRLERGFTSGMGDARRGQLLRGWRDAVARTLGTPSASVV